MTPLDAYIRRETLISVVINVVLGVAAFLVVFHGQANLRIWGPGGLVFDGLVQGFMTGLMSVAPPLTLARSRLGSGKLAGRPLPLSIVAVGSLAAAISCLAGLGFVGWLVAIVTGVDAIAFPLALSLKMGASAAIALIVTPLALRLALRRQPSPL